MQDILQLIASHRDNIILVQSVVVAVLLVLLLAALSRLAKLNRKYARLTRNTSGGNLEEILTGYIDTVEESGTRIEALEAGVDKIRASQQSCLQRVGLVRFDAFDDVGGEQSFAVVIMDAEKNGVAISSIYSRNDVRVYAKAISNGSGAHKLTDEEQKAISQAGKF